MSNQHVLKIHPAPLADLLSGAKTAEVRRNDRGFQVGDTVRLMEVNPETLNWTGRPDLVRTISHIQTGYGLPDGLCVLSYAQAEQQEAREPVLARPEHAVSLDEALAITMDRYSGALDKLAVIEQKEAQGEQAGDERAAFEDFCRKTAIERCGECSPEALRKRPDGTYVSPMAQCGWWAWQARATIATQPAAGEPVAWRYKERPDDMRSSWCYTHKRKGVPAGWPFQELFAAPPAAAHGNEAVRKDAERKDAERYQALREMTEGLDATVDAMIAEATAMRAQGDGEVQ